MFILRKAHQHYYHKPDHKTLKGLMTAETVHVAQLHLSSAEQIQVCLRLTAVAYSSEIKNAA